MSLKSRRGSHNLKFGGQTIPDAGGSNSKRHPCRRSFA